MGGRPKFTPEQILEMQARLVEFLQDGEFHVMKEIRAATGIVRDHIRAMPLFQDGGILALPDKGFALTDLVSADAREHVVSSMRSRCAEITRRADAIDNWII